MKVSLDDGFATHPKVLGLTDRAFRLHVEALCYAGQHDTEGRIPFAWLREGPELASELVSAGVWEQNGKGYVIHDFMVYNPSVATKTARSNAASNAARMRWALQSASDSHVKSASAEIEVRSSSGLVSKGKEAFATFWTAYPRKVGKPKALAAFLKALDRASADVILAGAQRLRDDPNREPQFTPHPTTWLNRDGWEDDPLPARGNSKPDRSALAFRRIAKGRKA